MNKWLHKFMEKPDISDKTDKWDGNLENMPGGGPDKTDRLDPSLNLSDLSGSPWDLLEEKIENMSEIKPDITDITDKTNSETYLSGLSGPSTGHFEENLENITSLTTDSTDKSQDKGLLSVLSVPSDGYSSDILEAYEERRAIAEYDGEQVPLQAQRIAYLDAFLAVLAILPYEETEGDWLAHRIRAAQEWLLNQGIDPPR